MSLNKLASAIATIIVFFSTQVLAQTTVPTADGWYSSGDAPSTSPKPACGKKPRDGQYVPLFKMEGGVYTACAWSYVGPKPSFFSGLSDCFWTPGGQYEYDQCLRYGRSYTGAPSYQSYPSGYVRPYVGRGPMCLKPDEKYSCNGPGDLNCQKVRC